MQLSSNKKYLNVFYISILHEKRVTNPITVYNRGKFTSFTSIMQLSSNKKYFYVFYISILHEKRVTKPL